MGSHSATCHPAAMTFSPLSQPKLVLDLVTPEGCKAELCMCTDDELAVLRAEFGHHVDKLNEYEEMRQQIDHLEGE